VIPRPGMTLLPAALAVLLGLFPPGWGARPHPLDSSKLAMPGALADGSRGRGFPADAAFPMRADVTPSPARLGQRLTYRAHVIVADRARAVFARPDTGGAFTWGEARMGRVALDHAPRGLRGSFATHAVDSVWLEVPLQVFATGSVSIPGPAVRIVAATGLGAPIRSRFPTVHLLVLPVVAANDSTARLRQVHGPLGAPWWERVPWTIVSLGLLLLAALAGAIVAWRRRRRRVVPPPIVPRAVPARDPGAEALAALSRLRARRLPDQGLFAEHAFELTRILRRYLESTQGTPRPGDTSGELVAHLRGSRLAADDVNRLEGLLGIWDRVKFARAEMTAAEAGRCELAVEQLVRRPAGREVA
jgi:hypothetical protein